MFTHEIQDFGRTCSLFLLAVAGLTSPPALAQLEFRQENCEHGAIIHKQFGRGVFDSTRYLLKHTEPESKQRKELSNDIHEYKEKYRDMVHSENKHRESQHRRELENSSLSYGQKRVLLGQELATHAILNLTVEISAIVATRMAQNSRIPEFDEARFLRLVESECFAAGTNR